MIKQRGFTLIEILLYTALIGSIMTSVVYLTFSLFTTRAMADAELLLNQETSFALQRIVYELHEAADIGAPMSGTSTGLQLFSATQVPTVIALSDGRIDLTVGSGTAVPLTSGEVEVTDLTFTRTTSTPPGLRVSLSGRLRGATRQYQAPLTLVDYVVIRR